MLRYRMSRQVDGEDASCAGDVPHTEYSRVRLDAEPRDRQPEAEARFIRTGLHERQKHAFDVAAWKTPAIVLDLDHDAIGDRVGIQRNFGMGARELERVLQQVAHRGEEQIPIGIDREQRIDGGDRQHTFLDVRFQRCGKPDFGNEARKGKQPVLDRQSGCNSNLSERAIDQILQTYEASIQYARRSSGYSDIARLDRGNRERRRMDEVAQLVRKES